GIAEMGLVSEEMGLDTPRIVFLHSCRVFAVMVMLPIAARVMSLFG
ncbi:MAG TPA: ammonia monooxygenase, partial [Sphaerochaeta sp.]|nr:ammonia monooxygenase [Sphaerochaeta sp.]